jgi:O-antigen/teichoic acid export membrane protein
MASSLNVLNQLVRRMVGIASLIILARILSPEDFGLVAIALLFLNFVEVVTNIGGRQYLLSREELNDDIVQSSWTLQFIIKNTVSLILAVCSVLIADFYEDPRLVPIILMFSLQILVTTCSSPALIYKIKSQNLGQITRWNIISRFVTTGITIFIAIQFETYWALIIGQFSVALSNNIASYVIAPMKPRFTLVNAKTQWEFSRWIMPESLINFFRSQIDAIYVSQLFDKAIMGAYNSMRYYANIPSTIFIKPIIGTTLTQFSEFKNNDNYFVKQLQVTFYILSAISLPMIYLMDLHDAIIVKIVLGEKWVEYSALLGAFSLLIFLTVTNSLSGQIAMLKDATRLLLYYSILCIIIQLSLFMIVDFDNVYQLARYKIISDVLLSMIFYIFVIWRLISIKALLEISVPIILSLSTLILAAILSDQFPILQHNIWNFLLHSFAFSFIYLFLQIILITTLRKYVYSFDYILNKSVPLIARLSYFSK